MKLELLPVKFNQELVSKINKDYPFNNIFLSQIIKSFNRNLVFHE